MALNSFPLHRRKHEPDIVKLASVERKVDVTKNMRAVDAEVLERVFE